MRTLPFDVSVCSWACFTYFLNRRMSSPSQSTAEVPQMMMAQSVALRGSTLKNCPPNSTMRIWPMSIIRAMSSKPPQPLRCRAERPVANARALNMFQN